MSAEMKANGADPSELLAVRTAMLQRSVALLLRLEAMITAVGGHMDYADQETLREAREFLVEAGVRSNGRAVQMWVDRVPQP